VYRECPNSCTWISPLPPPSFTLGSEGDQRRLRGISERSQRDPREGIRGISEGSQRRDLRDLREGSLRISERSQREIQRDLRGDPREGIPERS